MITYYDPPYYNLFLQDATAGVFVLMDANLGTSLEAGMEVEVEGVSAKGDFAPIVRPSAIHVLGTSPMPVPKEESFEHLATGIEDSQWVEVRGLVRSAVASQDRYYLTLLMEGQRLMVSVRRFSADDAAAFVGARVRIRGVCYTGFNMKRQLRLPWLAVSSRDDIAIESPSPGEPQEVSLASLAEFNSGEYYGRRLKISGVVTLQELDGNLYIQSGNAGLAVRTDQNIKVRPGDRVTVSGYIALGNYTPLLEDADIRLVGSGELPLPVPVTLGSLLVSPEDYAGVLIRLEASLMNRVAGFMGQTLVLQSSNVIFTAHLETAEPDERFNTLRLGSKVALTGVFMAQPPVRWPPHLSRSHERPDPKVRFAPPQSLEILLRSSADITVLEAPPWWTLARLLWTVGIMALILLAGLMWVFVLNRRVRQQTRIIQQKVKHEGVLEERTRIAREFHDTLEQELAAITIQLDAVEAQFDVSPEAARRQLLLARNLSRRSHAEARRSVWDLRSHLLENSDLATALADISARLSAASRVGIEVQCNGAPRRLAAVAEHHLLRIAQEALANAIKHSSADSIKVSLLYEPESVQLFVEDDGQGFDPLRVDGGMNGHFGLLDMRERAEKVGAHFSLLSQPGQGTRICVSFWNDMAHGQVDAHSLRPEQPDDASS